MTMIGNLYRDYVACVNAAKNLLEHAQGQEPPLDAAIRAEAQIHATLAVAAATALIAANGWPDAPGNTSHITRAAAYYAREGHPQEGHPQ